MRNAQAAGQSLAAYGAGFSLEEVEKKWAEVESMGRDPAEIAQQCALLCCVQRKLGYFAALHEGAVGSGSIVNRSPPLPLVLTWEGAGGLDEIYGMSLAGGTGSSTTLLQHLLGCVTQTSKDKRFSDLGEDDGNLKAKVSLLRGFADISQTPGDWTAGEHGLWYSRPSEEGGRTLRVYLPEVVKAVAGEGEGATQRVVQALSESAISDLAALPEGHTLYRFEALGASCQVSSLPSMKTREISSENLKRLLASQARLTMKRREEDPLPLPAGGSGASRFAALTVVDKEAAVAAPAAASAGSDVASMLMGSSNTASAPAAAPPRVCGFIVPQSGSYSNAHNDFKAGLEDAFANCVGKEQVRRIFVLAPVWDCYIDGCGLPERRCAWYGDTALDLVVLERLRSSRSFTELTVEQDMRERAIEALLPIVQKVLPEGQEFTLVPVLVGGLMAPKAELYTKLLAPYLADPANLFVVAGSVDELGAGLSAERLNGTKEDKAQDGLMPVEFGGVRRGLLNEVGGAGEAKKDMLGPSFDALELFLAVLAQAPEKLELSLTKHW